MTKKEFDNLYSKYGAKTFTVSNLWVYSNSKVNLDNPKAIKYLDIIKSYKNMENISAHNSVLLDANVDISEIYTWFHLKDFNVSLDNTMKKICYYFEKQSHIYRNMRCELDIGYRFTVDYRRCFLVNPLLSQKEKLLILKERILNGE